MKKVLNKLLIFIFLSLSVFAQNIVRLMSKEDQYNIRKKSVVRFTVYDKKGEVADRANGFFISKDGHFITSYHAVKKVIKYKGWEANFYSYDGKDLGVFDIIKCSNEKNKKEKERDLCLFKLQGNKKVKHYIPLSDFYKKHYDTWSSEYGLKVKKDKGKVEPQKGETYRCIGNPTGKVFEEVDVAGVRIHNNNFMDITGGIKTIYNQDLYYNKLLEVYDPEKIIRDSFSGGPCFYGKKFVGIVTVDQGVFDYKELQRNAKGKIKKIKPKSRILLLISADEIKEFVQGHIK